MNSLHMIIFQIWNIIGWFISVLMYIDSHGLTNVEKLISWYCGLWCGVKFPSYPATKSQNILLHNLDTIATVDKNLVQTLKCSWIVKVIWNTHDVCMYFPLAQASLFMYHITWPTFATITAIDAEITLATCFSVMQHCFWELILCLMSSYWVCMLILLIIVWTMLGVWAAMCSVCIV